MSATDPNAYAFPAIHDQTGVRASDHYGMTKRELVAMHILQGLLAAGVHPKINGTVFPHERTARLLADALLSELEHNPATPCPKVKP